MSDVEGDSVSSTQSIVLDLPPSCLDFCPAHPEFFVVGTYNLEKSDDAKPEDVVDNESSGGSAENKPQIRNGSIVLFRLDNGKIYPIELVAQPSAVFDLHFSPFPGRGDVCAAVSSTGTISFFKLVISKSAEESAARLQPLSVLTIPDLGEDVLFTFFTWYPTITGLMAITTASGQVILAKIHDDYQGLDVLDSPCIDHSLEAWVVAFSPNLPPSNSTSSPDHDLFTIFSGGDDSVLNYTSYHPSSKPPTTFPSAKLPGRHHTAGVTAILPLALRGPEYIILTGSYDDTLRIFRIAPLHITYGAAKAKLLAELNLGGGVWRLNVIGEPFVNEQRQKWVVYILASCMHAGARVLRVTGGCADETAVGIDVVARFEEHKSMNYGSDWSRVESRLPGPGVDGRVACVSTSFYDKLLCVWTASMPKFVQDQ